MSMSRIQLLRQLLQAEEDAAREMEPKSNQGTSNSFNNSGGGGQNFSGAKINSGAHSGDRNNYRTANNYGGRTVNNSGTFNGNGNGGFIDGDFHAPTTNYNYRY